MLISQSPDENFFVYFLQKFQFEGKKKKSKFYPLVVDLQWPLRKKRNEFRSKNYWLAYPYAVVAMLWLNEI